MTEKLSLKKVKKYSTRLLQNKIFKGHIIWCVPCFKTEGCVFFMSKTDRIFIDMCKNVLENGVFDEGNVRPRWDDGAPAYTKKVLW